MPAKVIGIGGVSQSGKSTLAAQLASELNGQVLIISQDDFVKPENEIPTIKGLIDWEHPDAIDFDRIIKTIQENRDDYDAVIVEGLLAFADENLDVLYDYRILLKISKETFIERRKEETRWGAEPDWYLEHVWHSYLKFGQKEKVELILENWEGQLGEVIRKLNGRK